MEVIGEHDHIKNSFIRAKGPKDWLQKYFRVNWERGSANSECREGYSGIAEKLGQV